jgi:ring-1,2-phenylacetyl-CoA epoxidase subunit PaaE
LNQNILEKEKIKMSTPKFHTLTVKNIRQETADCVSVSFEIPEELKNDYQYKAGQYITFKANIEAHGEVRRSYSICSAPSDNELRVAVKKVPEGIFSTFMNEVVKVGDTFETMTPLGNFVPTDMATKKSYYGFASGSGITPVLSIIKTVLNENKESTFTLIYGNKNIGSIIFKEELEALKNVYLNRFRLIHILSRERTEVELNHGRINTEKCQQLFGKLLDPAKIDEAFLCGPEEMILQTKDFLIANGVDATQIKFELFGTSAGIKKRKIEEVTEDTGPKSKVSIKVDDRTFDIELGRDGMSILDAALANGADLPFACKGGVCCTCRAKVTEGEVVMDVNYALEPDEIAQGFTLTCQAHPVTDRVVIDFDIK